MRTRPEDVRWLLRDLPELSFARRVKLTAGAFRILRDWRFTTSSRALDDGRYDRALVTFDYRRLHRANIHPWWEHDPEPYDYVVHEMLHVVIRALMLSAVSADPRTRHRLEEQTVRDICKVMGLPRRDVARSRR